MRPLSERPKIGDEGLREAIAACRENSDSVAPELLALGTPTLAGVSQAT